MRCGDRSVAPGEPRAAGLGLVGLAAVSWGTTGSVSTVLADRAAATPMLVGLARMWIVAVVLLAAATLARSLAIAPADRWRTLLTGVAMAVFQLAFFGAVPLAGIAVAALVAICSAPLMIAAMAALFLGEHLGRRDVVALVLGVTGAVLLVGGPGVAAASGRFVAGAVLALAAGFSYALYVVVARAVVARSAPLALAAATFSVAAVLLTPSLVWIDAPARQIELGWPWLLYLGGVATAAAYAMYNAGLRRVDASRAGIVGLLEPLTATLLGVLVFGERLGATGTGGAARRMGGPPRAPHPARLRPPPLARRRG